MEKNYSYVDNAESLGHLTQKLQGVARAAIDTEADSLHHYFEKVCLIQLSFSGAHYIIDPLAGFSLQPFFEVLAQKELIFQGADYDLRMLKKSFGFRPKMPVFDTMLGAQMLGYEKIGLAALVEKFFGVVMSKSAQKTDWSKRPLPERLLTYASDDTKYLEAIADTMTEQLQKLNRVAWLQECCERVVKTSGLPDRNEDKEIWRVKGSSKMPPNHLIFVRELWKWRDEEARKIDRPPFHILTNENLIELATWRAQNLPKPLAEGPVFLKRFTGESRARLEHAIRSAENTPQTEWPLPPQKTGWTYDQTLEKRLEPLLAACKILAKELQIESSFLASRSVLTAVAQHKPRSVEKAMETCGMMRWQAELLMPTIKAQFSEAAL